MFSLKRRLIGCALATLCLLTGLFPMAPIPCAGASVMALASENPYLVITALTASPETPSIGNTVTFTVTISNPGDTASAACVLTGFIDEQELAESPVGAIPAGAVATITLTWKAQAGPHVFKAVIFGEGGVIGSVKTLDLSVLTPDLAVSQISWQPVNPVMGDKVTFTVTVTNQGNKKAGSSQLDFCIDGASRGYRIILPLEPGSSVNETYTWAALSGQHLISATADVLQQVIQSDRTNDYMEATLSGALPDLIVSSLSIAPQAPVSGDNVTITAVIKNQGTGRAMPSIVTCSIGETAQETTCIGFLDPGATETVAFHWIPGENKPIVTVRADATDILQESDETNNTAMSSSPQVLPDLIIQNITWSPSSPVLNSPVTFTITVKNQGNASSGTADLKYGFDTIHQYNALLPELAPGETSTISFMRAPIHPVFTVQAAVNTNNNIQESNVSNNSGSKTVRCSIPPTVDFIVNGLTVSPAKPQIGGDCTLTLSVKNQGTGTSVASYAAIYLDDVQIDTVFINEIGAGAVLVKDIPISLKGLIAKDSYIIMVELNCTDNVLETDKANNAREITVPVFAPDLLVQGIRWWPVLPAAGERINFEVTVKNRGDAKSGSTEITYYIDNSFAGKHLTEAMEPGAETTRQFSWAAPITPFTLTVIIDEAKEILEADKTNNRKSARVPAPDLLIDSVTWSPEYLMETVPVTFTVNIKNLGAGQAGTTLLYCYAGNAAPLTFETSGIAPGSLTEISFTDVFTAGEHAIRFLPNGNNAVTESDASNNEKTIQLTVHPLPTSKSASATTPATPPAATPAKAAAPQTQNATTEPADNIAADINAGPPGWQAILLNKWLLIGVAVVGLGAIGLLMIVRKKGKKTEGT